MSRRIASLWILQARAFAALLVAEGTRARPAQAAAVWRARAVARRRVRRIERALARAHRAHARSAPRALSAALAE